MSVGTNITKLERVKRASSWGGGQLLCMRGKPA